MKRILNYTIFVLCAAACGQSVSQEESPSDGVVGSLPYRKGDYVGPTVQDGLTTIADNGEMYVYFSLTERDIMRRMEESGSMEKLIASFPTVTLQTAGGETYPL